MCLHRIRNWLYRSVAFGGKLIALAAVAVLVGCAAPKSREHRAIMEWQTEGHYVYRERGDIDYFVKCEGGLKYIGYSVPATANQQGLYESVGPVDVCDGGDEEDSD